MGEVARRSVWMLLLLAAAGVAMASGPGAVKKQAEASMLLTGTVDIEPDGRVSGHVIDRAGEVPPAVLTMLEKAVAQWRFEPVMVDGEAVRARTDMSLRIGAKQRGADEYVVDVRSARFGESPPASARSGNHRMNPPRYPADAVRAGVHGTVYLVLRLDDGGRVEEVVAEQVNLRFVTSERMMEVWRHRLAEASIRAAKGWSLDPASRDSSDTGSWSVRVPVDFSFKEQRPARYGEWQAYIPGPRQDIPWKKHHERGFSPDALAAGGVYPLDHAGPRLLSGLGGP